MHDNNYWSLYRGSNNGRSLGFAFFLGLAVRNNTLRFSNYWMMFSLALRTWNKINQNRRKMTRIEKKLRKWEMQPWKHSREVIQLIQLTNLDCHLRCLKWSNFCNFRVSFISFKCQWFRGWDGWPSLKRQVVSLTNIFTKTDATALKHICSFILPLISLYLKEVELP